MTDAILVYDDDCGFCTWWADFFDARSDIEVVGFSVLEPPLENRLPASYETCSHLVTDEDVYSCGESIEQALLRTDIGSSARPVADLLRDVPTYHAAREWGYQRVASNRGFWGRVLSKRPPARETDEKPDWSS